MEGYLFFDQHTIATLAEEKRRDKRDELVNSILDHASTVADMLKLQMVIEFDLGFYEGEVDTIRIEENVNRRLKRWADEVYA